MDFAGMDMSPDYTSTKLTESKMEYLKDGKLESSSELVLELTEYDIEREFARADAKLKNAGKRYTRDYFEEADMTDLMIDVILFTQSEDCMSELDKYAKATFYQYKHGIFLIKYMGTTDNKGCQKRRGLRMLAP